MIPAKFNPTTLLPNEKYQYEMTEMKKTLRDQHGVIIYFYAAKRLWYLPSAPALERELELRTIAREESGAIYQ